MFPKKVYHCPCVAFEIKLCLINGDYLLKDIISHFNENAHQNNDLMMLSQQKIKSTTQNIK